MTCRDARFQDGDRAMLASGDRDGDDVFLSSYIRLARRCSSTRRGFAGMSCRPLDWYLDIIVNMVDEVSRSVSHVMHHSFGRSPPDGAIRQQSVRKLRRYQDDVRRTGCVASGLLAPSLRDGSTACYFMRFERNRLQREITFECSD